MRVVGLNCLWHLFSDLLCSVKSFTPNPNELLINPHLIILEHLKNPNNLQIISKLKEEFSRTTENPEVDRFVSLIYSKLPAWKLMVLCLDLKRRATPGVTSQRCIIKLLETLSELLMHTIVCIIPNRIFSMNSDGVQYLTFRGHIFERRETLSRVRGMRNFSLDRYSSVLSPSGNIYLVTNVNGYMESPCWNDLPIFGECEYSDQGVEIIRQFTSDLRWCTNIKDMIIFDISNTQIDVVIKPVLVKIQEGFVLVFCKLNTNMRWTTESLAVAAVPSNYIEKII